MVDAINISSCIEQESPSYFLRDTSSGGSHHDDEQDEEEEMDAGEYADSTLSLDEVLYSASSYHAIAKPGMCSVLDLFDQLVEMLLLISS